MNNKPHTEEAKLKMSETISETWHEDHSLESIKRSQENRTTKKAKQQEVIKLYLEGKTLDDIVKETNVSERTINRIMKYNNIPLRGHSNRNKKNK
jgi:intein-encoded DNA endonuclease-like protein